MADLVPVAVIVAALAGATVSMSLMQKHRIIGPLIGVGICTALAWYVAVTYTR